jgi:hypothetical protein
LSNHTSIITSLIGLSCDNSQPLPKEDQILLSIEFHLTAVSFASDGKFRHHGSEDVKQGLVTDDWSVSLVVDSVPTNTELPV